jgi:hypothetical protein
VIPHEGTKERTMTTMDVNLGSVVADFRTVRDPRDDLTVVADALCLTEADVLRGWRAGETVAAMARHGGIDAKQVIDALVDDQKVDLAQRVEWGELGAEEAEVMRRAIPSQVVALVYYGLPDTGATTT